MTKKRRYTNPKGREISHITYPSDTVTKEENEIDMNNQHIKYEEIKQGCLFPLYGMLIAIIVSIMIVMAFSMKSCHKSNYDYSPDTINTVEDQSQLDEMRSYHSDKGLAVIENGYLVIKK